MPKLKFGDFLVTTDYRRGFYLSHASTANVRMLMVEGHIANYPANLVDRSGVDPTPAECALWARWVLVKKF